MVSRTKIASILYDAVNGEKISVNRAIKTYRHIDKIFSRKKSPSSRFTGDELAKHMAEATALDNKRCWTSIAFPAEILHPLGVYPLTLEVLAGVFSTLGFSRAFIDLADAVGIPNSMCSFHRVLLGLAGTSFLGKPSFVAATSILCDGNLKSFGEAARLQDVPFIYIDIPYELSDDAVDYVKKQLVSALALIEEMAGKKLDPQLAARTARNVNRTFGLLRRYHDERRQNRKNLYQGHELANFTFPMHFLLGSERLIKIIENRREDILTGKNQHKFYKNLYYSKKARRIMWLHIVPQYDNDLWSVIDDGERSRIVCDEYSAPYFDDYDETDLLGSIAKRLIGHPSNGSIERRVRYILKTAKEYNVDGMVHYSSWGCHQAAGNVQMLGRELEKAGYRFISINGDPIDQRNTSVEQHRTRLEAFLEN